MKEHCVLEVMDLDPVLLYTNDDFGQSQSLWISTDYSEIENNNSYSVGGTS